MSIGNGGYSVKHRNLPGDDTAISPDCKNQSITEDNGDDRFKHINLSPALKLMVCLYYLII